MISKEKKLKYTHRCAKCNSSWNSKSKHPLSCGVCKSRNWNKHIYENFCKNCLNEWRATKEHSRCPKCHSRLTDYSFNKSHFLKYKLDKIKPEIDRINRTFRRAANSLNKFTSPIAVSVSNENNLVVNPRRYEKPYIDLTKRRK